MLDEAEAHGAHPFLAFAEHTVHVHLGMAGKLTFGPSNGTETTGRRRLQGDGRPGRTSAVTASGGSTEGQDGRR